jgi:hypothetical protein
VCPLVIPTKHEDALITECELMAPLIIQPLRKG